ncbi:MAG: ERCC4 domain-containing protein [Promethearchaeota archaeon]
MNNNEVLHLVIDSRERSLITIFDEKPDRIDYKTKSLDIADVIVSKDLAIERKTWTDFIASIRDGRLFEQLIRLTDTYSAPVLILEGISDSVLEISGMSLSSIYGALAYIACKMGVAIIPTRNTEDTAIAIERIAYREQIKDEKPVLTRRAPKGMTIEERREFVMEGLILTGPKKAKKLIEQFQTPYKVIEAIKASEVVLTNTGKPKGIKGPLSDLSGFGWKYLKKNRELILGKE